MHCLIGDGEDLGVQDQGLSLQGLHTIFIDQREFSLFCVWFRPLLGVLYIVSFFPDIKDKCISFLVLEWFYFVVDFVCGHAHGYIEILLECFLLAAT